MSDYNPELDPSTRWPASVQRRLGVLEMAAHKMGPPAPEAPKVETPAEPQLAEVRSLDEKRAEKAAQAAMSTQADLELNRTDIDTAAIQAWMDKIYEEAPPRINLGDAA